MTRVATTNYAGSPTTTFEWATAGSDKFSRTKDLYYLAQAVEAHDHTAGKGLAVGLMANDSITGPMLKAGIVDASKLATDAVTAIAVALDAIGALELADGSVDTAALQALAVTGAKIAAATIDLGAKGIFPATGLGSITSPGGTASFKGFVADTDGILSYGPGSFTYYLGGSTTLGEPQFLGAIVGAHGIASAGPMTIGGDNVLHASNATVIPTGSGIPRADLSGKIDAWVTAATSGVPSGFGGWVPNAASIPSGYTRYANLDGRMPVGAGSLFSATFVEDTPYGSAWTHSHATSATAHTHTVSGSTGNNSAAGNRGGTGSSTADDPHTHAMSFASQAPSGSTATSTDGWQIPVRAIVWVTKN